MNFVEKLLTVYWSQTTLILLSIGYLIKRLLDNKSKKIEINYSIFQQKRLEALQKFITAYSNSEQVWRILNLDEVASKTLSAIELSNMVEPVLNDIKSSVLDLQIYLDNKDYAIFEKILNNTTSYNFALSRLYFNYETGKTSYQKLIEFDVFMFLQINKAYSVINRLLLFFTFN